MSLASFVIAGTEKAGTTFVYTALAQHPDVVASTRKETNFFRGAETSADAYAQHFPPARKDQVVMEASPGYLGEAETVVPRMRAMIPDVKLLFILREPVARFLSSYHFHRARLDLREDLDFHQYLQACLSYACEGGESADDKLLRAPLDEWHLKVLQFGCYADYLRHYFEAFTAEQIKVAFYDDLCDDPVRFMEGLSHFLDIDPQFWSQADLSPVNVTFSGRNSHLHRLAVAANDRLEPFLRPRPKLKAAIVRAYKRLNRAKEGYDAMSDADRTLLQRFYAPHNCDLQTLLARPLPDSWHLAGGSRRNLAGRSA